MPTCLGWGWGVKSKPLFHKGGNFSLPPPLPTCYHWPKPDQEGTTASCSWEHSNINNFLFLKKNDYYYLLLFNNTEDLEEQRSVPIPSPLNSLMDFSSLFKLTNKYPIPKLPGTHVSPVHLLSRGKEMSKTDTHPHPSIPPDGKEFSTGLKGTHPYL